MPTPISKFGEFKLINRLTEEYRPTRKSTLKGVGDDAAVLTEESDRVRLVTSDMLLEGVHFDLVYTPLKHLGYKAVVVNLSDIFAMNGRPEAITVSLGLSSKFSVEQMEELYSGMYAALSHYGVDLVGGDTCASQNGLVISITCLGSAKRSEVVYRHGAKPNDLLCCTGNLGAAYMGLMLLEREKRVFLADPTPFFAPKFEERKYIIERQLRPEARGDIIEALSNAGVQPTSMIDISDGLSSETHHLCTESGVGAVIYAERIPMDTETFAMAEELSVDPFAAALDGGEDYELLFTVPLECYSVIEAMKGVSIIGHITEKESGVKLVLPDGSVQNLEQGGWDARKALNRE